MSILCEVGRLNTSEDERNEHRSLPAFHIASQSPLCARPFPMFRGYRSDKFSAFITAVCLWDNLIGHWLIQHYCYRLKCVNGGPFGLLLQLCSALTVYIWNRSIIFSFKSSPALPPSSSVKLGDEPLPPSGPALSFLMRDPIRTGLVFKSFLPRFRSLWKDTDTLSHISGMHWHLLHFVGSNSGHLISMERGCFRMHMDERASVLVWDRYSMERPQFWRLLLRVQ